jgi:predicted transcriptional regulator
MDWGSALQFGVPKSAAVNIRLEEPVDRELESLARELGTTKSALIRLLTQTFLREVKERGLQIPADWRGMLSPADGRALAAESPAEERGTPAVKTATAKKRVSYRQTKKKRTTKKKEP